MKTCFTLVIMKKFQLEDAEDNEEAVRDGPTDSSSCEGEDTPCTEERVEMGQEHTDKPEMFDDHEGGLPDSSSAVRNETVNLNQRDVGDSHGPNFIRGEQIERSEASHAGTVSRKRTTSKNTEKTGWSGEAHTLHVNRTENKRGGRIVFVAFY